MSDEESASQKQPAVLQAPVQEKERIQEIDILRGFAIFGILVVNMVFFAHPIWIGFINYSWPNPIDQTVNLFIQYFAIGKFYTLFSLLFGLGLAVQLSRAKGRGVEVGPTYRRRILILLAIGLVHGLLIWYGDILTTYALLGFLLMLFRKRTQKTVLVWVCIFLGIVILLNMGRFVVETVSHRDPKKAEEIAEKRSKQQKEFEEAIQESHQVYSSGSYRQIMERRAVDFLTMLAFTPFFGWQILAIFLLGLYIGRRGVFDDLPGHVGFIRKVRSWALIIGLIGNTIWIISIYFRESPMDATPLATLGNIGYVFGIPGMSFFYTASILLALQDPKWRKRLRPLGNVGRMALSNYLLHSIVCTMIFYSYGLGFYGKVGPASGLLLSAAIYLLQIPLSAWWLKHYQFGPAEWFWRSLTYGKEQPMRRSNIPVSVA